MEGTDESTELWWHPGHFIAFNIKIVNSKLDKLMLTGEAICLTSDSFLLWNYNEKPRCWEECGSSTHLCRYLPMANLW